MVQVTPPNIKWQPPVAYIKSQCKKYLLIVGVPVVESYNPRPVFYVALSFYYPPTHRVILCYIMIFIIFSLLIFIKRLLLDARSTSQQRHNDIHNDIHNINIHKTFIVLCKVNVTVFFWTQETSKTSSKCT